MMNGKKNEGKRNSYNPDLAMIGENIRKRREALGMSQTELALAIETNRGRLSEYENGVREMGISKLLDIASILRCQPGDLCRSNTVSSGQCSDERLSKIIRHLETLSATDKDVILDTLELVILGIETKNQN